MSSSSSSSSLSDLSKEVHHNILSGLGRCSGAVQLYRPAKSKTMYISLVYIIMLIS